jgi:pimeloyl-ACP methyl ester carboxylesterase
MNSAIEVTTNDEIPAFFAASNETLFGILTRPALSECDQAVIVLSGGGSPTSLNRNRLSVRLCRRFAAEGFHAMRFDYRGIGESSGVLQRFRLHEPFSDDVVGATNWLKGHGLRSFFLLGSCFGARTALAATSSIPDVAGLILVCPPIRDFEMGERLSTRFARELSLWGYLRRGLRLRVIRQLSNPRARRTYARLLHAKWRAISSRWTTSLDQSRQTGDSWLSPSFVRYLEGLVQRHLPILIIYGTEDDFRDEFEEARSGRLGAILETAGPLAEVETVDGRVHGFVSIDAQSKVADIVSDWLRRRAVLPSPAGPAPDTFKGHPS